MAKIEPALTEHERAEDPHPPFAESDSVCTAFSGSKLPATHPGLRSGAIGEGPPVSWMSERRADS
jgi:hypothetical protein